jgi:Ser/Thr protein kinase RdoA (MazF antagonist)
MKRAQLLLTEEISQAIKKLSRDQGVSQSETVRQLLLRSLAFSEKAVDTVKKSILEQPRGNMAMDRVNFDELEISRLVGMWDKGAKVINWEPFKFGYSNKIYKVNIAEKDPVVLKIAVVPQRYDKLAAEIKLVGKLAGRGIPLPEIVFSMTNRLIYKYPFVIYRFIDGENLMEVIDNLPKQVLAEIAESLGEMTAKLHKATQGDVIDFGRERIYKDWVDFVTEIMDNGIFKMKENNLRADLVKKVENLYAEIKGSLVEPNGYSFIHRDLQAMNILVKGPQIVGLLDFESAMSGDYLYEFAFLEGLLFDRYPVAREPFYKGYRKNGRLPENYKEIIGFYTVMSKMYFIQRAIEYKEPDRFKENFDYLDRFFRSGF